jgi:hypothetical protein
MASSRGACLCNTLLSEENEDSDCCWAVTSPNCERNSQQGMVWFISACIVAKDSNENRAWMRARATATLPRRIPEAVHSVLRRLHWISG